MVNHPNRSSYNRLIAKLQRISVSQKNDPDVRRLAIDAYQQMIAAQDALPTTPLLSDASYYNRYGNDATAVKAAHKVNIADERAAKMDAAMDAAMAFLAAWSL
jgi:hypothetical protein